MRRRCLSLVIQCVERVSYCLHHVCPYISADPVDYDEPQEEDEGDSLSEDDEKSSSPESDNTSSVESEDSLSSEEVELPQRALQSGRARQSKSSRRNVVVSRPILSKYNLRSMRRRHQHMATNSSQLSYSVC